MDALKMDCIRCTKTFVVMARHRTPEQMQKLSTCYICPGCCRVISESEMWDIENKAPK